ncbi:MAG: hypothetical protein WBH40_10450 [Ignavibacteriaceae bacterium]
MASNKNPHPTNDRGLIKDEFTTSSTPSLPAGRQVLSLNKTLS